MIDLQNVTKYFGKKRAVDTLNLHIDTGSIFGFLGPNGAGKTTTIKMITGLIKPSHGSVRVCDIDVAKHPRQVKKIIGYVPDQPFVYDKLTGIEFIRFMAEMYEVPKSSQRDLIEKYVTLFEMEPFLHELAEGYSHGMKQRLALTAMLVHQPKVIIVDEPLVGLDPQTSNVVRHLFREEARRGCTVFMSTHVISIAESISDTVGIIVNGKLIQIDTPQELRMRTEDGGDLEEAFLKIVSENRDRAEMY